MSGSSGSRSAAPAVDAALARVLASQNPFADAALRNGFEQPADLPAIHAEVRATLRAVIDDMRRQSRPRMLVVTGEPGDGKTHLLACLRAEAERHWFSRGQEVALVPVEPLRDPEAPFAHLLRAMAAGLSRQLAMVPPGLDTPGTPLELLLWRFLLRATETLADHPDERVAQVVSELAREDLWGRPSLLQMMLRESWWLLEGPMLEEVPRHLALGPPHVDGELWSVICRFPRPGLSGLVCRWLGGQSMSEDELRRLSVRDPIEGEERSLRALRTLVNLSQVPIVLGLDQLEGVRRLGEHAVPALFEALTALYSEGGRLLLMLFCQASIWAQLRAQISQHALDRVEAQLNLGSLPPALGEALVSHRLGPLWRAAGAEPPHPTAPYPEGWVRRAIEEHGLRQPRRLLSFFARLGVTDSPPGEAPTVPLRDPRAEARRAHRQLVERLAAWPQAPEERAATAEAAIHDLLRRAVGRELALPGSLAGVQVLGCERAQVRRRARQGIQLRLRRAEREVTVYLEASNQENGRSAAATVDRLAESLAGVADKAVLLREQDLPLPPSAADKTERVGVGVAVVAMAPIEQLQLAALEKLLNAAVSRDVDIEEAAAGDFAVEELLPTLACLRGLFEEALRSPPPRSAARPVPSAFAAAEAPRSPPQGERERFEA